MSSALANQIVATYPWLGDLGLFPLIEQLLIQGASTEQIVAEIRNTPQYQQMFPGMYDPVSGQRQFDSEAQYLATIEDYRSVLQAFGAYDASTDDPMDYLAWINSGVDPSQLEQRFQVYDQLQRGGQDLIDAFYVFAGLQISVDDLYQASVSGQFAQEMTNAYDQAIATQTFDYSTYIQRATQLGLERAAEALRAYQQQGLVTGQVVSNLLAVDVEFAQQVMGALFTGGVQSADTQLLSLSELINSFEQALLGAAATGQGLEMPTVERIEELRALGVQAAQANQAYGQFVATRGVLQGAAERHGIGEFGQDEFERAVLLRDGVAIEELERLTKAEMALGARGGSFRLSQGAGGRIVETGRFQGGGY